MSDTTQTNDGGGTATTTETSVTETSGGSAPDLTHDLTAERSANKQLKDFAKARGVTVADLLKTFEDTENASKSELERERDRAKELERRYTETETALRAERTEKAIRDAAASAGARADRLPSIYRIVRDDVAFDDDGKPTNVAKLIDQARTEAPEFFQRVAGSGDGGKGGGGDNGSTPNAQINAALRQMSGHAGT